MELDDEYNEIFIRTPINDDDIYQESYELPTLHMIILYCEWFLSEESICNVRNILLDNRCGLLPSGKFSLEQFNDSLNSVAEKLCEAIGQVLYVYAISAIGEGEVSIPLGLAPSFWLFSKCCSQCSCPLYIRTFCLSCGKSVSDSLIRQYKSPYIRNRNRKGKEKVKPNGKRSVGELHEVGVAVDKSHSTQKRVCGVNVPNAPSGTTLRLPASLAINQGTMYNPVTKTTSIVTTFSLQRLLELSRQGTLASAALHLPSAASSSRSSTTAVVVPVPLSPHRPAATKLVNHHQVSYGDEIEVVDCKKEIEMIDLMDSSSDDEGGDQHGGGGDLRRSAALFHQHESSQIGRHPIIKEEPAMSAADSAFLGSVYTTVTQSSSRSSSSHAALVSQGSFLEGEEDDDTSLSDEDHGGDSARGLDSEDGSSLLLPVKLEWPARRMDEYEMCAMRGTRTLPLALLSLLHEFISSFFSFLLLPFDVMFYDVL